jgi:hypothetical protein
MKRTPIYDITSISFAILQEANLNASIEVIKEITKSSIDCTQDLNKSNPSIESFKSNLNEKLKNNNRNYTMGVIL